MKSKLTHQASSVSWWSWNFHQEKYRQPSLRWGKAFHVISSVDFHPKQPCPIKLFELVWDMHHLVCESCRALRTDEAHGIESDLEQTFKRTDHFTSSVAANFPVKKASYENHHWYPKEVILLQSNKDTPCNLLDDSLIVDTQNTPISELGFKMCSEKPPSLATLYI